MNNLEVLKSGIEGFGLEASDKKLQNLKKYREILVEWNKVMNLTESRREIWVYRFEGVIRGEMFKLKHGSGMHANARPFGLLGGF